MRSMLKRRQPSPAMIVALVALVTAMAGTAFAGVATISKISGKTVKKNSLPGNRVKKNSLPGNRVKKNSVTGRQVKESSLSQVPNAANANTLGGIAATGFTRPDCTSQSGAVKGFARVLASATFSGTFTTTGVEAPYNCSGGTVEARRLAAGAYEVRFNGANPPVALVSVLENGVPTLTSATGAKVSPGTFRVQTFDTGGIAADNVVFAIAAF